MDLTRLEPDELLRYAHTTADPLTQTPLEIELARRLDESVFGDADESACLEWLHDHGLCNIAALEKMRTAETAIGDAIDDLVDALATLHAWVKDAPR